ncbi:MAG: PP2C family protein-serine/threonine phosphatase, partial [Terriglobia bacterium]
TLLNEQLINACVPLRTGDRIGLGVTDTYALTFKIEEAVLPGILEKLEQAAVGPVPQLRHLSVLLQMARMLNRAPALEEVLTTLLDTALRLTDAERGLLFLTTEDGKLHLHNARDRRGVLLDSSGLDDYSHTVVERVAETGVEEVVLEELGTGLATQETGVISGAARGIVAVPLLKLPVMEEVGGETVSQALPLLLGVLYLDSRSRPTAVTSLDREVLQTLAVEGATVIENARLFRIARQQERNQHDLALARSIQQSLLPRQLPEASYFDMHALTMSCQTVGGDYHDVVPLPGDRYGITVADVAGKGLPAAMMAVTLQGIFTGVASGNPSLADLFARVNAFLYDRTPSEMYATLFYGVVEPEGNLQFVNAGHVPPLLIRPDGSMVTVTSSSFPVGLFAAATFQVDSLKLEPGDKLLIFSDGVTEAQNVNREFFGDTRLEQLVQSQRDQNPREICKRVVMEVQSFAGNVPQADDLTVLCFELKS